MKLRPTFTTLLSLVMASVAIGAAGALSSCAGRAVYEDSERKITLRQPSNPNEHGTVTITPDGGVVLSVSGEHKPASYTEKATVNGLMIIGGLFAVCAVALFIGRVKFPLVPSNAPVGCAIASAACFMMPTVIERYTIYIVIGGAGWLAWTLWSFRHNKMLKDTIPSETTPNENNHAEDGERATDDQESKPKSKDQGTARRPV